MEEVTWCLVVTREELDMRPLILFFISGFASSDCACEKSELAAITGSGSNTVYIYAAEGTSNGSFDLKTFLRVVQFNNTSHTLPFILNPGSYFLIKPLTISCSDEPLPKSVDQNWITPLNITMNAILYGCNLMMKVQMRFFVYNNDSWSERDRSIHCRKFKGVPTRFLSKMNRCLEDFQDYSKKCTLIAVKDKISGIYMMFAGILILIAILFAVYSTYKHFTKVSAVSNGT